MKKAFTLIELLVVLTIITLVMGVVVPKGAKMLESYQKKLKKIEVKNLLSKYRVKAFLEAKDFNKTIDKKNYFFTKKGLILETKSHDND